MRDPYFNPENEPGTEDLTRHRGSNTVSEFYRMTFLIFLPIAVVLICVQIYGFWEADLSIHDIWASDISLVIILALVPSIMCTVMAVYSLIQYFHYSRVELINVQNVVANMGDGYHYYRLSVEVNVNGETTYATTHRIFGHIWSPLDRYVGRIHRAGYDAKRKCWVII